MKSYWDLSQPVSWSDGYFCEPDDEMTDIFVSPIMKRGYLCEADYEVADICEPDFKVSEYLCEANKKAGKKDPISWWDESPPRV